MFLLLAVLVSANVTPSLPAAELWPTARAGRVLSSPDWSDYRIYPRAALVANQEGRVVPEILVGADGRPRACRVLISSNFKALDEGTCNLMMQMRFEPVSGPTGAAIPSRYTRAIIWGLTDPRPFSSSALLARVRIGGGRMQACDIVGGEGPYFAFWSGIACSDFGEVDYYFGDKSDETLNATIDVRLNARDGAPFLSKPLLSGQVLSVEKLAFSINEKGDASHCTPLESRGFGSRGMNNLSPCGRLLSALWFNKAPRDTRPREGIMETRVILTTVNP